MATINKTVQSGNQVVLVFDGVTVGLIQSLSCNEDYAPEPARGVGSIEVAEYVPTVARYQLQLSRMILKNDNLRKAGILFTDANDALTGRVFDILTIDKDTKQILRKYSGCSFATGSTEIRANAIVVSNATFMALSLSGQGM